MKIKCADTRMARNNLESAVKLGPMFYIRNYVNDKIKNTAL